MSYNEIPSGEPYRGIIDNVESAWSEMDGLNATDDTLLVSSFLSYSLINHADFC